MALLSVIQCCGNEALYIILGMQGDNEVAADALAICMYLSPKNSFCGPILGLKKTITA